MGSSYAHLPSGTDQDRGSGSGYFEVKDFSCLACYEAITSKVNQHQLIKFNKKCNLFLFWYLVVQQQHGCCGVARSFSECSESWAAWLVLAVCCTTCIFVDSDAAMDGWAPHGGADFQLHWCKAQGRRKHLVELVGPLRFARSRMATIFRYFQPFSAKKNPSRFLQAAIRKISG